MNTPNGFLYFNNSQIAINMSRVRSFQLFDKSDGDTSIVFVHDNGDIVGIVDSEDAQNFINNVLQVKV